MLVFVGVSNKTSKSEWKISFFHSQLGWCTWISILIKWDKDVYLFITSHHRYKLHEIFSSQKGFRKTVILDELIYFPGGHQWDFWQFTKIQSQVDPRYYFEKIEWNLMKKVIVSMDLGTKIYWNLYLINKTRIFIQFPMISTFLLTEWNSKKFKLILLKIDWNQIKKIEN